MRPGVLETRASALRPHRAFITDIARDGMLAGPDLAGLAAAAQATATPLIASGGVATLADVAALKAVPGIAGVITGKALYEGRFTVAEALLELAR